MIDLGHPAPRSSARCRQRLRQLLGHSMATPHVTGAIAFLHAVRAGLQGLLRQLAAAAPGTEGHAARQRGRRPQLDQHHGEQRPPQPVQGRQAMQSWVARSGLTYCTARSTPRAARRHRGERHSQRQLAAAFTISAGQVLNNLNGIFFYGTSGVHPSLPGAGCASARPSRAQRCRTAAQSSASDARAATPRLQRLDPERPRPQLVPARASGPFWSRDPLAVAGTGLTDALSSRSARDTVRTPFTLFRPYGVAHPSALAAQDPTPADAPPASAEGCATRTVGKVLNGVRHRIIRA